MILKLILGVALVPSSIAGTVWYLEKQGFFNIENIETTVENSGDQSIYLKPLVKNLDDELESMRGVSLWKVDIAKLRDTYSKLSWIDGLSISRRWPSRLKVNVHAKEVDLLLMTKNGKFIPIVESGDSLPAVELKQIPDVAVLRGENFETRRDLRKKVVGLLKEIPADGPFSQKSISEIHFDDRDGFWVTLVKNGILVKMGHDQIAMKSTRVSQVLEYVDSRQLDARVIDANLSKKVLVRLRKEP